MRITYFLIVLIVTLMLPRPALAWNKEGHMTTPTAKLTYSSSGGFSDLQMRLADSLVGYPLSLHSQKTVVQPSLKYESECYVQREHYAIHNACKADTAIVLLSCIYSTM